MRKGQKQREKGGKALLPKVSLHSFFKPKNAKAERETSTQAEKTRLASAASLAERDKDHEKERKTGARGNGNPFTVSRARDPGRGISLGSNANPGTGFGRRLAVQRAPEEVEEEEEEEEAAALSALPMSQGPGIVWRHSPAKKAMEDAPQERRPLTDLIRCVAKPLESTKTVNTKNKNKAIEELMLGGNSSNGPTQESLSLHVSNPSALRTNAQGESQETLVDDLTGSAGKTNQVNQNPFARKRPAHTSTLTHQASQQMGTSAKIPKHEHENGTRLPG